MQTKNRRLQTGFTLIEMLVVIVIILILMGVVFRMVRMVGNRSAESVTEAKLSKLKAAVEEFYAEYGLYPPVPYYRNVADPAGNFLDKDAGAARHPETGKPWGADALVQPVRYERVWEDGGLQGKTGTFKNETWDTAPAFTFGLISFLTPRFQGAVSNAFENGLAEMMNDPQWRNYNDAVRDQPRDVRACERWAPFLKDVVSGDHRAGRTVGNTRSGYTNVFITVHDGWEHEFVYVSPPPHQSYLLFSRGRDNAYDYNDPHNRASAKNKDNIYGDGN